MRIVRWICGDVPPVLAGIIILILVTLAVSTRRYVEAWHSNVTLWTHAAVAAPYKARPLNNLGVSLVAVGRWDDAKPWFERAHTAGHAPWLPRWDAVEGERTARDNLLALETILERTP